MVEQCVHKCCAKNSVYLVCAERAKFSDREDTGQQTVRQLAVTSKLHKHLEQTNQTVACLHQ